MRWALSKFLMELPAVHPSLPGGSPLTVRLSPLGWRTFTRTEVVAASLLMTGSSGRDPAQYALCTRGESEGQRSWMRKACQSSIIPRAGRWKSRTIMTYVREAGEGAGSVSAALAKTG